jgi:hypothetical protein
MKAITTAESLRKADFSFDATPNPVALRAEEIVSWPAAFAGSTERALRMSGSALPSVTARRTR